MGHVEVYDLQLALPQYLANPLLFIQNNFNLRLETRDFLSKDSEGSSGVWYVSNES